jgi:hypothetical protein
MPSTRRRRARRPTPLLRRRPCTARPARLPASGLRSALRARRGGPPVAACDGQPAAPRRFVHWCSSSAALTRRPTPSRRPAPSRPVHRTEAPARPPPAAAKPPTPRTRTRTLRERRCRCASCALHGPPAPIASVWAGGRGRVESGVITTARGCHGAGRRSGCGAATAATHCPGGRGRRRDRRSAARRVQHYSAE